jgi:hypothetical protein
MIGAGRKKTAKRQQTENARKRVPLRENDIRTTTSRRILESPEISDE